MPDIAETPEQQEAYDNALKSIIACYDGGGNEVNLDGYGLTRLPPEIGKLTALTELDLSDNRLSTVPPEIRKLTALRNLDISSNELSSLPPDIGNLTALRGLYLSDNQLRVLAPEIGNITALTELDLSDNLLHILPPEIGNLIALRIFAISGNQLSTLPPEIGYMVELERLYLYRNRLSILPAEIRNLTALTELNLARNYLNALPPEFGKLKALTKLDCSDNQLSTFPSEACRLVGLEELKISSNQFKKLPDWFRDLPKLKYLLLHDNPAIKVPANVLGPDPRGNLGVTPVSAKSILDFYFGTRRINETRPLNEIKLIMVGRGGAGKTSTVRALGGGPFKEDEESTPGIALCDWKMDGCKNSAVTAHVWDFAGQVITHALHQFFFSMRSLYVLVLTGRENNERDDAEYWLRLIKAFGTDEKGNGPPVIVALNKWDMVGCRPRVDRSALQERYPFIRGFVEVDCKSGKGVAKLNAALCKEVDRLKWVRDPFPETWDAVRRAMTTGRKKRAHLSYAEYRALCTKHGVTDPGQQDSLAEILHNLGAALNYRNDPRLREATVLQPEWLTKNVYGLMRRAEKRSGVLTRSDVDTVLRAEKDQAMRDYLVQIMERFEIAYVPRSTGESEGTWLVPQALPDQQPKEVSSFRDITDATRLRYSYPALPEGLVARAIVRLHEFIEEKNGIRQQWASGVILNREHARALIRTEMQDRQVTITVTGPTKARQQLAGLCQAEMREIHAEIRGLNPTEETQYQGTWVQTTILEMDEKNRQQTGIAINGRGTVMVDPAEPNNAYSEKRARSDDAWKPTAFISYSKSNVNQRKRLESELKILKNEGLLAGHWHDRMIDPGDEWNNTIQSQLTTADIIIILASSAALATEYITVHEIPKALDLHQSDTAVVVPVILEDCRWHKTELGKLNALPEKGKAINTWGPQSGGWNSVANGLAEVLHKRMVKNSAVGVKK